MAIMYWEKSGQVARLVMNNGENRHNPEFNSTMLGLLDEIEADQQVTSLVISSSDPKSWSQGIDLGWILAAIGDTSRHDEVRGFMHGLNDIFRRLLTFPVPVIAAIGGHAFGDGAIMSCACDFRLMRSDRGFFCFPEVDISIPFMPGMQAVVMKAIPRYQFDRMSLTGARFTAPDLERCHVITKASTDLESLEKDAMDLAESFSKQRNIFSEMKRRANKEVLRVIDEEDPPLIESLTLVV